MKSMSFVVLLFLALVTPSRAEVVNRIVATLDGEPITQFELDGFLERQRQLPPAMRLGPRKALEMMITERLVAKEIESQGIVVRDDDIDTYIERITAQNQMDRQQLERALAQQGLTWEKYREQIRNEIEKIQLLNKEIRGRVNVTPEDVKRHYEAVRDEKYRLPAKVRLRHVVLRLSPTASEAVEEAVFERIGAIRERIVDDGEDFAEVAREVSEDPAAADGGDLGAVRPDQILPEFATAIEDLEEGEVSEPIRTQAGVHLVRLDERIGDAYTPLEEVEDSIEQELYSGALDKRYRRWLREDLWNRHYVEIRLGNGEAGPAEPVTDVSTTAATAAAAVGAGEEPVDDEDAREDEEDDDEDDDGGWFW